MLWKCSGACKELFDEYKDYCPICPTMGCFSHNTFYIYDEELDPTYYEKNKDGRLEYNAKYRERIKNPNYVGTKKQNIKLIKKFMASADFDTLRDDEKEILKLKMEGLTLKKISERIGKRADGIYSRVLEEIRKNK
jgi:hypothetical protein